MLRLISQIVEIMAKLWDDFLREERLPTEAELRDAFPHAAECSANRYFDHDRKLWDIDITIFDPPVGCGGNLEKLSRYIALGYSHWGGSTWMKVYYLRCKQCGQEAPYQPDNSLGA